MTDRDIEVLAVTESYDPQATTLADIMPPKIVAITRDEEAHEAMAVMRKVCVRRLAVTGGDGSTIGVLSLDDVVDALAVELSALAEVIRTERQRGAGQLELGAAPPL